MPDKDLFERIHPDFSNSLIGYMVKNNVKFKQASSSESESKKMILVTRQFISERMAEANKMYIELKEDCRAKQYNDKFTEIWGESIKLSEIHEYLISDIAAQTTHITLPLNDENIKEYVLARLLSSAIRTYQEIILLLRNGYPYGATSLTRVLFEIAIITRFISGENKAVALAYYNSASDEVDYNSKYEWARASGKFNKKFGKKPENITIQGLRKASGLEDKKFDNLYTIYCNFSHSAPQIVNNDVDTDDADIYAGPKTFGIDAPGIHAARFICDSLNSALGMKASLDLNLKIMFCMAWMDLVHESYKRSAERLDQIIEKQKNNKS